MRNQERKIERLFPAPPVFTFLIVRVIAIFKFSHFKFTLKFINQLINIGSLSRDRLQILLLILIKFKSKLMNFYPPEIIRKRTGF